MEQLYIGGEYVESTASSAVIEVENPATEEVIAEVPDASARTSTAPSTRRGGRSETGGGRTRSSGRAAPRVRRSPGGATRDELAVLLTREGGKTLKENRDEVDWSVDGVPTSRRGRTRIDRTRRRARPSPGR